jgi:hypothetical protein
MREHECRSDPIGTDRLGRLYFLLGPAPCRVFVVDGARYYSPGVDDAAGGGSSPPLVWRSYCTPLQLRRVIAWLSPRGRSESSLRDALLRHQQQVETAMMRRMHTLQRDGCIVQRSDVSRHATPDGDVVSCGACVDAVGYER